MSMTIFLAIQLIGMFFAYFFVTTALPMVVFNKILKHRRLTDRVLLSYLFGNTYIITIVQVLQLLHISFWITLIIATLVPAFVTWVKINDIPVKEHAEAIVQNMKWVVKKQLGVKTLTYRLLGKTRKALLSTWKRLGKFLLNNLAEVVLAILLLLILLWVYGFSILGCYGYSASDLPVHNYWINALSNNNIFVAGVYPHGYHCMMYFLHEVFGFDTYVLLSQFAFVQVVCVHFTLLFFLKLCCKMRFLPYIGVFAYAVGDLFISATTSRFVSTLPQEFGMIFILPAIAYGFSFFQERYNEEKEEKKDDGKRKESWYSLCGFAMSFSLTLSAHFYNTIIAGIFCVAMALGYLFLFVRKQYFKNIVITCLISVLIAILPMGIAFATGTPLEGSLIWASNIMKDSLGGDDEAVIIQDNTLTTVPESGTTNVVDDSAMIDSVDTNNTILEDSELTMPSNPIVENITIQQEQKVSLVDKVAGVFDSIKTKARTLINVLNQYTWSSNDELFSAILLYSMAALLVLGVVYIILRKPCYGAMLWTCTIYTALMLIILGAGGIGLPTLMDPGRACIYVAYSLPIVFVVLLDAILYLCTGFGRLKWIGRGASFALFTASMMALVFTDNIRSQVPASKFETNEAITCLANIMRQEKDFTWTICSANDELRMCEENGYHYELITFLRRMENINEDREITIPTSKVYFFIEKIPLDYAVSYENSGQSISAEGASKPISFSTGLAPYQGENRWITMSRIYYWAQEFQRMYPNEMKVYMETDQFICYVVEQNTYSLYNFAIDYGYNVREQ